MKKLITILGVLGCLFLVYRFILPPLADRYGNAWRYANSCIQGDSYEKIDKEIPWWLVHRQIHKFDKTDIHYVKPGAEEKNIEPEYVMVIENRFFPFNWPHGYALYFDENKLFLDYAGSGQ